LEKILFELNEIIKKESISQYKLSKDLKISQSYINEMLNGKKKLNMDYVNKICNYLGYEIIFKKKC
jgi:plasmid maintenance system antidote protein VapI